MPTFDSDPDSEYARIVAHEPKLRRRPSGDPMLAADRNEFTIWNSAPWMPNVTRSLLTYDLLGDFDGNWHDVEHSLCRTLGSNGKPTKTYTQCTKTGNGLKPVVRYGLQFRGRNCPSAWTFQGSHDNVTWTALPFSAHEEDTEAKVTKCVDKEFVFFDVMHPPSTLCRWGCPNTVAYRYYRWDFTKPVDAASASGCLHPGLDLDTCGYQLREARLFTADDVAFVAPSRFSTTADAGVPGEFLRVVESEPQMSVTTNGVRAACAKGCDVSFRDFGFAVTDVQPRSVNFGDEVTVTGANFGAGGEAGGLAKTEGFLGVTVGEVPCVVKAGSLSLGLSDSDSDSFSCILGAVPGGNHSVEVTHPLMGLASQPAPGATGAIVVQAEARVTGVSPVAAGLEGGTLLTITGVGFSGRGTDNTIEITDPANGGAVVASCAPRQMINYHCDPYGRVECDKDAVYGYASAAARHYAKVFDFSKHDRIECEVMRKTYAPASGLDVTVTAISRTLDGVPSSKTATLKGALAFSLAATPVIDSIEPPVVAGATQVWLRGTSWSRPRSPTPRTTWGPRASTRSSRTTPSTSAATSPAPPPASTATSRRTAGRLRSPTRPATATRSCARSWTCPRPCTTSASMSGARATRA